MAAAATLRALGEMLGVAMVRLVRKYPVETVILVGADDIFPAADEYISGRLPVGVSVSCKRNLPLVDYAAGIEAAQFELHCITKDI